MYSLELARALQQLDVEPLLAVTGPSPRREQRDSAAGIRLIDTGLPLEWLDTSADEIRRAGEELARIAADESVDLVQTSSAAILAGAAFDRPRIAVQHSCIATWWAAVKGTPLAQDFEWRRDLVGEGLANADAIVAPTNAFAGTTMRSYGLDRRVIAVHNGRSERHLRELPHGEFVFTAGRLWDEAKNASTMDRVAARIEVPFQAAGPTEGPNGASVELEHLFTLGELSEAKLAGVLAARPIYASAALYEPFGLSVLEAAQAGCALVLSDVPTHRELWDGAALFVETCDDFAFASAIGKLLKDRSMRQHFEQRSRQRARRYSPGRMARKMADIYSSLTQPQLVAGAA